MRKILLSKPDFHALNATLNLPNENGQIDFDADRQAVREYFLQHVNQNTVFFHSLQEKLDYLVTEGYYEPHVLGMYTPEFIIEIYQFAFSKKFRFSTFLGAYKYYTGYTLKTRDGQRYLERFEDRVVMAALVLGNGNPTRAKDLVDEIISGRFQPATPTFLNAGKAQRGELVSCFLFRLEDNMESIGRGINSALQLSKRGGGVALLLSNLRELGAPIKGIENQSSGVVPVMKMLEDGFSYANQLGARQGAGAVYLNVHHPDILRFLDTKRENADEKIRIKTLSLGVVIPDITFEIAKRNEDMYLFSPYDVERVYGKPFGDISVTELYNEMVDDSRIRKTKINARALFQTIAEIEFESGYPYILFEDTANKSNPIPGRINMSNLCVHGDTLLLTDQGQFPIKTKVGQTVNVWNGKQWSETVVVKTGDDQDVTTVRLDTGDHLTSTLYHKWYLATEDSMSFEVRTMDLRVGDVIASYSLPNGTTVNDAKVVSIDWCGASSTYCVNEPLEHKAVFNGILTGQCSEILQVNTPSELEEDLSYKVIGEDISCNLGSVNIAMAMDSGNLAKTVDIAVRALTVVAESTSINSVPSIRKGNENSRAIGLGQMNMHGYLAREHVHYDSPEAVEFTSVYFAAIAHHCLRASCTLAKETKKPFVGFEQTKYATGEFFDLYTKQDWLPQSDIVKEMFRKKGVVPPTRADWELLKQDVMTYGLYNRNLQAIPPTGSISYINNSTSSIHPIASRIEIRKEGKIGRVYYPAPYLNNENMQYYRDAYEIGPNPIIDVYAAATPHVDQGLSLTLFFLDSATTRDINKAQIYAWKKGVKTIYYIRLRQEALEGTEVEACVGCVL